MPLKLGDKVQWSSGSRGLVRAKHGEVVAVIPPGGSVVEYIRGAGLQDQFRCDQISEWRDRNKGRVHRQWSADRYLIAVRAAARPTSKPILYLPRPEKLRPL